MPSFKTEKALLLQTRLLGERTWLLSMFTPEKGRYTGVVKAKKAPDIASLVDARWQARLEEQTGNYYIDGVQSLSVNYLDDRERLAVIASICALLHQLLPERQIAETLYQKTLFLLKALDEESFLTDYLFWEIDLLKSIGFGLDLTTCAGGGDATDLAYISPKTGRAVSYEKGFIYRDKLLKLPRFLWQLNEKPSFPDLMQGFTITTYFLTAHTGLNHLPVARERLIAYLSEKLNKNPLK